MKDLNGSVREAGIYQVLGSLRYFIPHPLPPKNPGLILSAELTTLYGEASFALGKLNEMGLRIPDPKRFIKGYVIKEALLSSAIEGIHTTLIDVFTPPLGKAKLNKDTQLVVNYTKALDAALEMIKKEGFPLVERVILKAHEVLMLAGEGDKSAPGIFRNQSVRVGELIPPPAPEIPHLIGDLEHYINTESELPILIRAGLVHIQFETIHPFLDGNGRIGRLLIVLMLIHNGLLTLPILYPSYYFKRYQFEYYQKLDGVRTKGDFEGWVAFYLKAIRDSATDAYRRAKEIENLEAGLKHKIRTSSYFLRIEETAEQILDHLFFEPITNITEVSQRLGKAYNTIRNVINRFVDLGWVTVSKVTARKKIYQFELYLALLEKDYEW